MFNVNCIFSKLFRPPKSKFKLGSVMNPIKTNTQHAISCIFYIKFCNPCMDNSDTMKNLTFGEGWGGPWCGEIHPVMMFNITKAHHPASKPDIPCHHICPIFVFVILIIWTCIAASGISVLYLCGRIQTCIDYTPPPATVLWFARVNFCPDLSGWSGRS